MSMNIKKNKGFTLIELMVTVSVLSILVVVGIPQMTQFAASNRLSSEINQIVGALNLARSESVKRGRVVTICGTTTPNNNGAICNSTDWEDGWIVFMDVDRDREFDNGTDIKIKIGGEMTAGNTLRLFNSDNFGYLQYRPDGSLRDQGSDGFDEGTFVLCDQTANANIARAVNINRLGRTTRAEDGSDAGKVVEDDDGNDVSCT